MSIPRRTFMKGAVVAGAAGAAIVGFPNIRRAKGQFGHVPFTRPIAKPPVKTTTTLDPAPGSPQAKAGSAAVFHGIAPEYDPNHPDHQSDWAAFPEQQYHLMMMESTHQFVEGVDTPIFGYDGMFPGPTFLSRFRQPSVVRATNLLPGETSVHLHGGHEPAHSDGYPDFYVLQNETRDYFYPNIAPRKHSNPDTGTGSGPFDVSQIPTTMWYHDHGMDITGLNVDRGLAGFYLNRDELEDQLIADNILPEVYGPYDIPMALADKNLNPDGTLNYDLFDHNGHLGDIFTVNGIAQPYVNVERRKYRFRILNASNARYYHLRLTFRDRGKGRRDMEFLQIGKDSWEFPWAMRMPEFTISPGERFDLIVDFSNAPDRVYLQNIMHQTDGRKPKGIDPRDENTRLVEFRVSGPPVANDLAIEKNTRLRPFRPYDPNEVVVTRHFDIGRRRGAWVINSNYFSPRRSDATPIRNSLERWVYSNGGGWWHPMHSHLEGMQVESINGKKPGKGGTPKWYKFMTDLVNLEGGDEVSVLVKFRTFKGPFVSHCHIVEHEDMRMMMAFDPRDAGEESFLDGETPHNSTPERIEHSGMPIVPDPDDLLFEHAQPLAGGGEIGPGDFEHLKDRGVGIPLTDFDPEGNQDTPFPDSPIPEEQQDD